MAVSIGSLQILTNFTFFTYPLGCNSTEYFTSHRASSRNKNMYLQTKQHLLHSICIWDNPTCTYETQAIVVKVVHLRCRNGAFPSCSIFIVVSTDKCIKTTFRNQTSVIHKNFVHASTQASYDSELQPTSDLLIFSCNTLSCTAILYKDILQE